MTSQEPRPDQVPATDEQPLTDLATATDPAAAEPDPTAAEPDPATAGSEPDAGPAEAALPRSDEDVRRSRKRMIQPRRPLTREEAAKRAAAREAATADESVVIRTRKLTKAYGELVAVDRLDLEVRRGEVFGLLGQNGAGKTTTILMLLGLTEVTDGEARVVGLDPTRNPLQVKRRVGYLPDSVGFYDDLTGRENLRYTARLNRIPDKEANDTIEAVLDQVGLLSRADDRTDTYSRGMIQRLGIADALVKDPDVLILDEPTTAIDPLGVVEILELLRRVVDDRGTAILLSSHLLNQVQEVCDRIGIFAGGRLIGQGTLPDLATRFGEAGAHIEVSFGFTDEASAASAESTLKAIDGVSAVRRDGKLDAPWAVIVADRDRDGEVRNAIIRVSLQHDYPLVSIRSVQASLEDIYRRAVARTAPAHGAVA
jgi:ABC-2 type transport system ATP-binding protein